MTGIEPVTPSLPRKCSKAPEKVKHNFHIFQIFLNILFFHAKTLPVLTLDSLQSIVNGLG